MIKRDLDKYILKNIDGPNILIWTTNIRKEDFSILRDIKSVLKDNKFISEYKFDMLKIIQHLKTKIDNVKSENKIRDNAKLHIPVLIKMLSLISITPGYEYHPNLSTELSLDNIPDSDCDALNIINIHQVDQFKPPISKHYDLCIEILESKKFKKYDIIFMVHITNRLKDLHENEITSEELRIKAEELNKIINKVLEYLKE